MIDTLMAPHTRPKTKRAKERLCLESRSLLMNEFIEAAHRTALTDATILLTGDSGTGKSAFARQIHRWSGRTDSEFLSVDCAAIPELAHDNDPFEDLRTSLTALQADRQNRSTVSSSVTLLLDNLAELRPAAQARLLQFVEERQSGPRSFSPELRVRVIAASSHDLAAEVSAGHFRSDLFYRINVIALKIPALVDRPRDILLLTEHLLEQIALHNDRPGLRLSDEAASAIASYSWPGNVRELRNAIERAAVLCIDDLINLELLPDAVLSNRRPSSLPENKPITSLQEVERRHIIQVLKASSTMEEAAAALGINSTTLWRKRKLYKIEP